MGPVVRSITRLGELLFANGCSFLLPGFFFYLIFWVFSFDVSKGFGLFVGLNFLLGTIFVIYIVNRGLQADILFWLTLWVVFWWPGAYLEFPSDAWDHMWRIFRWSNLHYISEHKESAKYGFFWIWSLLSWVPVSHHRVALDAYNACAQLLVVYQVYLFSRRLRIEKSWAMLQCVAFVALFGSSVFSYRYYALSSTPLAYVAYLRSLIIVLDIISGKRREVPLLFCLLCFMGFNHLQELLFFFISVSALYYGVRFGKAEREVQNRFLMAFILFFVCSLVVGWMFVKFFPGLYSRMGLIHFSSLGTFKILPGKWRITETLGIHGFLSLGLAVLFFRRFPILASVTLAPFICLLNPFVMVLLAQILPAVGTVWRLLFAMPTALMFVIGLRELLVLFARLRQGIFPEQRLLAVVFILIMVFGLPAQYPWNGRLFFQFYRVPESLALKSVDQLATWIDQHMDLPSDCLFLADLPTTFALQAHLGKMHIDRRHKTVMNAQYLVDRYLKESCGVVVSRLNNYPSLPPSIVGRLSKHWSEDAADLSKYVTPDFEEQAEQLVAKGWKKHSISPLYDFYAPPQ